MRLPLTVAVAFCACAGTEAPGPPYQAEVLELIDVDPESGAGRYELVVRPLDSLEDLERLEGPALAVRRGGTLRMRSVSGSVVMDGRFEASGDPDLRYDVQDGVVVALDYSSLIMLSAYRQFERVLAALELVTGEPPDALLARVRRLEIFFEPVLRAEGDVEATVVVKFNAFYMPGLRQFGLAKRAELEGLPLGANLKVIAHEAGHALFEQYFLSDQFELCEEDRDYEPYSIPRLSLEWALSGFNEGFGDWTSFVVTGSASPLQELDLGSHAEQRSLLLENFDYGDLYSGNREACSGQFYCIGTLWARSLFATFLALAGDPTDPEERGSFSQQVVAALRETRAAMVAQGLLPPPPASLNACNSFRVPDHDAKVAAAFLAAFVSEMPEETRPVLCAELAARFSDIAFPGEARLAAGCPADEAE